MRHPSDGLLRRLQDEPAALPASTRAHAARCARCQDRQATIAGDARAAAAWLSTTPVAPNRAAALARLQGRLSGSMSAPLPRNAPENGIHGSARLRTGVAARSRVHPAGAAPIATVPGSWVTRHVPLAGLSRRRAAPLSALLAAAVVLAALLFAPLGALAQGFVTIFVPQQFVAVPITRDDLYTSRGLPDLGAFGVVHAPATAPLRTVADRRSAAALAGMIVRVPGPLPAGVPGGVRYMVMPRSVASFTFSATKASHTVARGGALPPMPPHLDGTALRLDAGPVVLSLYGAATGGGPFGAVPTVAIVQAHAPVVGSTGVPVRTVEDYLLRLPGVSPHLAAEIRAIGDPSATLPLPVPLDLAAARSVPVHGARAMLVSDSTGLVSGVIWHYDGMVYGVIGTLPSEQILAVARSLDP